MTTEPANEEKIRLRTGPSLVIWELLIRTLWNPEARKEVSPGNYELLFRLDEAERRALNYLAARFSAQCQTLWNPWVQS